MDKTHAGGSWTPSAQAVSAYGYDPVGRPEGRFERGTLHGEGGVSRWRLGRSKTSLCLAVVDWDRTMMGRDRSAQQPGTSAACGKSGFLPGAPIAAWGGPSRVVRRPLEAALPDHPDDSPAGLGALTPRERAKLAAIMARLASPHDGERAAAGLLASAFVAKHGLTWADLIALARPIPAGPTASKEAADRRPRKEQRRKGGKLWRGFCRRRPVPPGQTLDRLA